MILTLESEIFNNNENVFDLNDCSFSNIASFNEPLNNSYVHKEDFFNFEQLPINIDKEGKVKEEKKSKIFFISNKKRGRKESKNKNKNIIHNKYNKDNLLRKIQNHFLNFIVSYINEILEKLKYIDKFYFLNYKYKHNVKKKFIDELKKQSIGEILCQEISPKYLTKSKYSNIECFLRIKNNPIIKLILSENYLDLFSVYYNNIRTINLNKYGLSLIINLPNKIEMYHDLIKKSINNPLYIEAMNQCAKDYLQNY